MTKSAFTPGPLTFDGFGINGGDEYHGRIATFVRAGLDRPGDKAHYGPLFAAAPDMLEALRLIASDACRSVGDARRVARDTIAGIKFHE